MKTLVLRQTSRRELKYSGDLEGGTQPVNCVESIRLTVLGASPYGKRFDFDLLAMCEIVFPKDLASLARQLNQAGQEEEFLKEAANAIAFRCRYEDACPDGIRAYAALRMVGLTLAKQRAGFGMLALEDERTALEAARIGARVWWSPESSGAESRSVTAIPSAAVVQAMDRMKERGVSIPKWVSKKPSCFP